MAVTPKVLVDPQQAPVVTATVYTSPSGGKGAYIDKFTGTNVTAVVATLTINLVKSAGAASAANTIVLTKSLAAGECYTFPEIVGSLLAPGDFVSIVASTAASITVRASGRELS